MSTIRFHLRGSRALINGSLAVQNDGFRAAGVS
jgi:hypothetical protein